MAARRMIFFTPLPLVALLLTLAACGRTQPQPGADTLNATIGGRTFTLELALDESARFQGLSDRASIAENGGMLFVFPDARVRQFVMRRCLVPIDIVFLSPGGRIVAMHEMDMEPYDTPENELKRYSSQWPAQFALEFAEGTIDALGLEVGQRVDLPLEALKGRAR